jgi:hypothetical protein
MISYMPASLEDPERNATASGVDRVSIHELFANATGANHHDWYFDIENPTSENELRYPRSATNMTRRDDRSW